MLTHSYSDISLDELDSLRQQPGTLVVDVRDEWEFDEFNLGGLNLPLPDIRARKDELTGHDPLIVVCSNGTRSRIAIKDLLRQPEFQQHTLYHLHGGLIGDV
ncbi:rhodanese-like domain-containing protein [Spirosoma rhododendri]|uniref:Rhodanese-like domain-containing protein n=1 Tax=Spirosoma rhododendri TaxID=2728024 RepID=A0A7L5DNF2_9BACT|nr:rhodanese-like domain-containing protein [Spirosoma rhododendri]QJD79082.1 rhodanese-like domain-containing protein [Spirosoma rhododendri]